MKIKVLIVDDERLERVLIKKGFPWEENGYEIIGEASSAKEALEFVEHRRPDVIFTDISMPQMDGLELAEQIQKTVPRCRIVIVTGYREFEYARRAVQLGVEDFLLKPVNMEDIRRITEKIRQDIQKENEHFQEVDQLKKTILADKDIMMESFFQRLVEERIDEEEALRKLELYECTGLAEQCVCVNIQLKEEQENQRKTEEILELIEDRRMEDTVCFVHYMKNIILYFLHKEAAEVEEISGCILKDIIGRTGIKSTMGISETNRGYQGISRAYRQSRSALGAAVLLGRERVITYEEYRKILEQNPDRKELDWEDFIFSVSNCLFDKTESYIQEYVESIKMSRVVEKEYLGLMCMNLLSKAGAALNRYGQSMAVLLGEKALYDEIKEIATVQEAEDYLKRNMKIIMDYLESRKAKQGNKVVGEALEYVDSNIFDPDLSLKVVAAKIFTNESYLSRIFKKETGVSLIEYISRKRIDESIRLLTTTDLKVYEIAEKIGFRDPHYFSICFKKQTGVTIKQFKNEK